MTIPLRITPAGKTAAPCRENPEAWTATGHQWRARARRAARICQTRCTLHGNICTQLTESERSRGTELHGAWDGQVYGVDSPDESHS